MNLLEVWIWADTLSVLAFSSSEPLEDRVGYALWWADLGEVLTKEF
jgi:hypothetical protein